MTNELHTLAVTTDTRLAALHGERAKLAQRIASDISYLHHLAGHKRRHGGWGETMDGFDPATLSSWDRSQWDTHSAQIVQHEAEIAVIDSEISALDDLWVRSRWSRFFLVLNNNGHIHRDTHCQTCRWDTNFGWLPQLSGLTEAEAVADQGEILCSVCYPSAPVAWSTGESKASLAAKAERAAAKAERDAKRLAKALLPDGSGLTVRDGVDSKWKTNLVTLASAKTWLTDSQDAWGTPDPESVRLVAAAIAAKMGTTPEAEIAAAKLRASKRK